MALVLKTQEGSTEDVEIVGGGVAFADGKGGIVIDDATRKVHELQKKDDDGNVVFEDGIAVALKGKQLEDAAKDLADRYGLRLVKLSDNQVANLAQEAGRPADRPAAQEVAEEEAAYAEGFAPVAPTADEAEAEKQAEAEQAGPSTEKKEG